MAAAELELVRLKRDLGEIKDWLQFSGRLATDSWFLTRKVWHLLSQKKATGTFRASKTQDTGKVAGTISWSVAEKIPVDFFGLRIPVTVGAVVKSEQSGGKEYDIGHAIFRNEKGEHANFIEFARAPSTEPCITVYFSTKEMGERSVALMSMNFTLLDEAGMSAGKLEWHSAV